MTTAQTIFDFREEWKVPVTLSAILHVTLFAGAIGYSVFEGRTGESWGGAVSSDGALKATLVSSAVPLPSTPVETENVLANESKGLSESKPAEKIPEPEAIDIPEKTKPPKINAKEKAPVPKPKTPQQPVQQAANAAARAAGRQRDSLRPGRPHQHVQPGQNGHGHRRHQSRRKR
jgi:hypothetical protein